MSVVAGLLSNKDGKQPYMGTEPSLCCRYLVKSACRPSPVAFPMTAGRLLLAPQPGWPAEPLTIFPSTHTTPNSTSPSLLQLQQYNSRLTPSGAPLLQLQQTPLLLWTHLYLPHLHTLVSFEFCPPPLRLLPTNFASGTHDRSSSEFIAIRRDLSTVALLAGILFPLPLAQAIVDLAADLHYLATLHQTVRDFSPH